MPQIYRKPMCAKVLGWAANWFEEGSFSKAVLEDIVKWGEAGLKTAEAILTKRHPKSRIDDQ